MGRKYSSPAAEINENKLNHPRSPAPFLLLLQKFYLSSSRFCSRRSGDRKNEQITKTELDHKSQGLNQKFTGRKSKKSDKFMRERGEEARGGGPGLDSGRQQQQAMTRSLTKLGV